MIDDIVTRLREFECRCELVDDDGKCDSCQAADEIERLQRVVAAQNGDMAHELLRNERLRAAGDALAERLRWWTDDTDEAYPDHKALLAWQDVRLD